MKMFCTGRSSRTKKPFLVILGALSLISILLFSGSAFARDVLEPINPTPEDGETGVSTGVLTLYWEIEFPAAGAQSYDVYFGTDPDPAFLDTTGDVEYMEPGDLFMGVGELDEGKTYYWRVVAHYLGDTVSGPTWSFKTEDSSGSGCNAAGALNPLFLLLLAPLGLLRRKSG